MRSGTLLALVMLFCCGTLSGQVMREIGLSGGGNSWPFNFTTAPLGGRYQTCYSAAELNLPGGGQLTEIQIRLNGAVPAVMATYNNQRVRCAHTNLGPAALTANMDTNFQGPLDTCFGPVNHQPAVLNVVGSANATFDGNYARFILTTPYAYNGTSNLLIDYSMDSRTGSGFTVDSVGTRSRAYLNGGNWQSPTGSHDTSGNYRVRLFFDVGPTIATSVTTLPLGATVSGTASPAVQYTVSASSMTAPTTINAPAGVEISLTQATGYTSSIQLAAFPAIPPTTIYVRIADNTPVGAVSGVITHTSPGAPNRDVSITGNVVSLSASTAAINLGMATIGAPGVPQSYDLTGAGLINATSVTAPAGFEVATAFAGPYGPTANIATMPAYIQSVWVRLTGQVLGVYAGDVVNNSAPATVNIAVSGSVVPPDNLHATRIGPNTTALIDNNSPGVGGHGHVLLTFTLETIMSGWTVTDLTFTASGSADEQQAFSELALYEDAIGGNFGLWDGPFVDQIATAGPGVSFNGPNGTYTAALTNGNFPPMTIRRFFLVGKLAGKATTGQTLKAELTAATGTPSVPTGLLTGVPTNSANAAFEINDAEMTVTISGPVVFQTVNNNDQGPGGDGLVALNLRIAPKNDSWNVSSLTFTNTGTMDGQADVSFLGLYVDNGNGIWDGPTVDLPATATTGINFNAPNGEFVAGLNAAASVFAVNQTKRLFLVAKLAGTASTGETLRVAVSAMTHVSPTGGGQIGVPTGSTSALIIDQPTLTVNAGPQNPAEIPRQKSAAGLTEMIGQFRFSASNSAFTVNGFTLHTGGNGDWLNKLDAAAGVQVFRDNGNGTFDPADVLLFSGGGASPSVSCTFTTAQQVAAGTDLDVWVVLNGLASAGGSPAETFEAMIASAASVSISTPGTVKIGSVEPQTGTLRVIDFSVSEFTPTVGLFAGGASIKIVGTGFALPVTLSIGGVVCPGTPIVDAAGTSITGLTVPAGTGTSLPILLTTNGLPAQQLTDTFRYSSVLPNPNATTTPSESSGCVAGVAPASALLIPAMLGLMAVRRRKNK